MLFVNFHGYYGSKYQTWISWLKKELENEGQELLTPEFPTDDWDEITRKGEGTKVIYQNLNSWFKTFEKYLVKIEKADKLTFIGHSLGPLFILHILNKYKFKVDKAIFVAPFLRDIHSSWQIWEANKTFYNCDFDISEIRPLIKKSYSIYSDNDPFVNPKYAKEFAEKLGSEEMFLKGLGHFNTIDKFELVLQLCLEYT